MFLSVFSLLLIFQSQNLVSANNVLAWTSNKYGNQLEFPQYKNVKPTSSITLIMKSPSGELYKAKCDSYSDKDTKVDIFTKDGIFLDTLVLANTEKDPCDQTTLLNYITPKDAEKGQVKMTYLWSGKSPECVEVTYKIHEFVFKAIVQKSDYPRVTCPAPVSRYLTTFVGGKSKAGGIVSMGPIGTRDVMDYNANVASKGKPKYIEFPNKDLKGKPFKFICQEDNLKSEDPETKKNTITTGQIVHEGDDEIVLDKFKLTSCDIDNINVNRKIFNDVNIFKIVFKTTKGVCYEREYEYFYTNDFYYYKLITVLRTVTKKVKCPKSFVGDIAINASQPWYKSILKKKVEPYSKVEHTKVEPEKVKTEKVKPAKVKPAKVKPAKGK